MKLSGHTIDELADMIAGGPAGGFFGSTTSSQTSAGHPFPYRTGTELSKFFRYVDESYVHQGSRVPGTEALLERMNGEPASHAELPSDVLIRVVRELMQPRHFDQQGKDRNAALAHLNASLRRDRLEAVWDASGTCQIRSGSTVSVQVVKEGGWSHAELELRKKWEGFLSSCSEDEFTEQALVPLLRASGFQGIQVAGHKDKALEYGKDLKMKFRLPTGHFIYFAIQVKKDKLDASGKSKNENVTEVLNQVNMALLHPVFDAEVGRKCLIDHVYVMATGEITKAARNLLVEKLDADKRRQLIFMDRGELLDLLARRSLPVPESIHDELPF
jgi:hypothetical protein